MQITDQRIVLTGAASGIGRALLTEIASYRCHVVAADRDTQKLAEAVAALAPTAARITAWNGDIGTEEGVDALFDCALDAAGGIDLFIANAGFAYYEQLSEPVWDRLEAIYRVNTLSPIYATVKMRQLNEGKPYRVVVVASAMGLIAIPGYAVYGSTKAALHRFAEGYRLELPNPVMLTMVYPIGTRTGFFSAAAARPAPAPWPTHTPEKVARAIVRGIERDRMDIHPSGRFRTVLLADRFMPFVRRVEQAIEGRRLRDWLRA